MATERTDRESTVESRKHLCMSPPSQGGRHLSGFGSAVRASTSGSPTPAASSQFSPRLLRTFTRDRFVHLTLALFPATFTYALTVLRAVRNDTSGAAEFVPRLSVTVAFVLAVASVLGLVVFLAHLARQIRVETMLRTVFDDASSTVGLLLDERGPDTPVHPLRPVPPPGAVPLLAGGSGFLVRVDESELLDSALQAGAVVLLDRHPGSFVVAGTPIGLAWPHDPLRPFDGDAHDRIAGCAAAAVTTGFERTAAQDVGFGLRQLTDIANKALSPGINDPTTAVHALGHSAALLCELAGRELGPRTLRDGDGRTRVVLARPTLADLVDLAIAQPRRYGAADPAVLARIIVLLRELAWCVPPGQHAAGRPARPAARHRGRPGLRRPRETAAGRARRRGRARPARTLGTGAEPRPRPLQAAAATGRGPSREH